MVKEKKAWNTKWKRRILSTVLCLGMAVQSLPVSVSAQSVSETSREIQTEENLMEKPSDEAAGEEDTKKETVETECAEIAFTETEFTETEFIETEFIETEPIQTELVETESAEAEQTQTELCLDVTDDTNLYRRTLSLHGIYTNYTMQDILYEIISIVRHDDVQGVQV